ncbi:MAG: hypothetical protein GC160_02985 [Acidobacteria bacterium]|nr:hypothetical protein [Acidobacteriota bacterium]
MRLLALALLGALRLGAACDVASFVITEAPGDTWVSATVEFGDGLNASTVDFVRLARAVSPSVDVADIPGTGWTTGGAAVGTKRFAGAQDLTASTTYNFVPQLSVDNGSSYALDYESTDCQAALCPYGEGPQADEMEEIDLGYSCVANGSGKLIPQFTTDSNGGMPTPAAPTHSISLSDFSAVTGETRVGSVTDGLCTDCDALLADALADASAGGLVEGLQLPAGATWRPGSSGAGINLAGQTSDTGAVIILGSAPDPDALPALGEAADPSLADVMSVIEFYPDAASRLTSLLYASAASKRIRIQNVVLRIPDVEDIADVEYEITSVNDAGSYVQLSVDGTIPAGELDGSSYSTLIGVYADGFEGWSFRYGAAAQRQSGGAIAGVAVAEPAGIGNFTTGWVVDSVSKPFASATKASEPVLTLPSPHRWIDGYAEALTGCSSGTCTAADGSHVQQVGTGFHPTYQITGSSGGACDGFFVEAGGSQASGTFVLTDVPDCTGGSIKRVGTALLSHLQNVTSNPLARSCIVTFPSATEVKLWRCRGAGSTITPDWSAESGTISGRISYGAEDFAPLVNLTNMQQVIIERCILRSPGPPVRINKLIAGGGASQVIVANNYIDGVVSAHPIDPVSGHLGGQYRNNYGFDVTTLYDGSQASDVQIVGNTVVNWMGFFWFAPNGPTRVNHPADITISRNRFIVPLELVGDSPVNYGIVDNARQGNEDKDGVERKRFSGNSVLGYPIIGVNAAHILVFQDLPHSSITTPRRLQDIGVYSNILEGGQIVSAGAVSYDGSIAPDIRAPRNIAVRNNLIHGKETVGYPNNQQLLNRDAWTPYSGGNSVFRRIANIDYSYNTHIRPATALQPASAVFMNGESYVSRINVEGNIWEHSPNGYDAFWVTNLGGGSEANGWNKNYTQDGAQPSPLASKADNIRLPCTTDPGITDYDSDNSADSESDASALGAYSGWSAPAGSADAQSCKDREELVFAAGTWQAAGDYAGLGADIPTLLTEHRKISGAPAITRSNTTVSVAFTAPTAGEACHMRMRATSAGNGGAWTSWTATTGSTARTVQATGLTPATSYDFRLSCEGGQAPLFGQVTTL